MDWPHLTKAPVKEAIVDIRIAPTSQIDPAKLHALHKLFVAEYPDAQARNKIAGVFSFAAKPGEKSAAEIKDDGIDGYVFRSADKLNIVQMRLDGFSYSRLAPYTKWSEIQAEASRLWDIYAKAAGTFAVTRVAMRYINLLPIEGSLNDLNKFIEKPPVMPAALESKLFGYLEQNFLNDTHDGFQAILIQAVQPPVPPTAFEYILDIDVFLQSPKIPIEAVWGTLEKLRDYKNRIFFNTLKKETWERFQ